MSSTTRKVRATPRTRSATALLILALAVLAPPADAQKGGMTRRGKECSVKSNADKKAVDATVARIDHYGELLAEFYDGFGLEKRADNKVRARLFASYDEFEEFRDKDVGPKPWSAYWSTGANAIVLYHDPKDVTLQRVLFHECQHQYLARFTTHAPKWLNEGLSECVEGWRFEEGDELEDIERRPMLFDLTILQVALREGEYLPLAELVDMSAKRFVDFADHYEELHSSLHYATSWGLVYYCLELAPADVRARFAGYLHALNAKGAKAQEARFEVDDWAAFEAVWKEAILALEPRVETAEDHTLLATGYRQNAEYEQAIREYEAALVLDPDAPGLRYWLGYCTKRTGDYDAAVPRLEAAHEHDPEDARPAYMLARIYARVDRDEGPTPEQAAQAVTWAEAALERAGQKSAFHLAFLAECHFLAGDSKAALQAIKKALRYVDDEELEAEYEERLERYR